MRLLGLAACALLLGGCLRDTRPSDERGASGLLDTTPNYDAPKADRCQALASKSGGSPAVKSQCDDARYLAQRYVRGLSPGDSVCLENTFGEEPGAACSARAVVRDVSTTQVLLKVEDAKPDSRWYKKLASDIWFDNGALVDLYLAERGY